MLYGSVVFASSGDIADLNSLLEVLAINANISAVDSIDLSSLRSRGVNRLMFSKEGKLVGNVDEKKMNKMV